MTGPVRDLFFFSTLWNLFQIDRLLPIQNPRLLSNRLVIHFIHHFSAFLLFLMYTIF